MSKEKQIEEMVMELAEAHHEMDVAWTNYFSDSEKYPKPKTEHLILAEHLYNAGYRKQSEGEWIKINPNNLLIGEYYCSCCNSVIDIADGRETPLDREMYYCPNCGAKMKGGEE